MLLQFLCKRNRLTKQLVSVQVFSEDENIELGVAEDMARIEGLQVEVFLGADLIDVVQTHPAFFEAAGPA
jgi:hypothetical protein